MKSGCSTAAKHIIFDSSYRLRSLGHTFDGKVLHRDVGNYQLVDIHDPLLASMIHDERARKDKCDVSTDCERPRLQPTD